MGRRRSGRVEVDVSDVIDAIDDDDLLDELKGRGLTPAAPGETVDMEIVAEAYEALKRHAVAEAVCILDRLLFPKWKTKDQCEQQYKKML